MNQRIGIALVGTLVVALVLGLVFFYPTDERKRKALEKEFRAAYSFDISSVEVVRHTPNALMRKFGKGDVVLRNKSGMDWEQISLILNPSSDFLRGVEGFRAPKDQDEVYLKLSSGESMGIPYSEFVHTRTREKFSLDRYELATIYVRVQVPYKGEKFYCENTFEW